MALTTGKGHVEFHVQIAFDHRGNQQYLGLSLVRLTKWIQKGLLELQESTIMWFLQDDIEVPCIMHGCCFGTLPTAM